MEEKKSKVQKVKQYVLQNKVLVTVAACLFICILGMNGAVTSSVKEKELLNAKLQEQTVQYEKLQDSYGDLQTELGKYEEQQEIIEELKSQLTQLQEQYDLFVSENEILRTENDSLKSQVASLEAKVSEVSTPAVSSTVRSVAANDSGGGSVWLSATGSKYHSIPDCGNMNPQKARQISKSSAEAQGYEACSKCW